MAFTVRDYQDLVRLLDQHPEWQAELRRLLLADDFLALPAIVRDLAEAQRRTEARLERLEATVQSLAEAQQRTEARLEQLAAAQERTEARLEQLAAAQERTEARLEQLAAAQERTEARLEQLASDVRALTTEVRRLADWQRGEAGRRDGDRYEFLTLKRAPALFNGGEGGATHQTIVQRRLMEKLKPLLTTEAFTEDEDPFLADLIWWKGEQFLVVEVSLKVNGNDVARAARRAETLQRANVQAIGMVIGEDWTGPEARRQAEASAIQWKVADGFSEGWLDFRRLAE